MTSDDYLRSKENANVTKVTEFLWWCAGADSYFLKKSPKQDRVKYAGIGGIVFATGVLAMVSGWFAFFTAFGQKSMAGMEESQNLLFTVANVFFAIAWGLMIFNLDRFIISSTGKGDGTDKITAAEFGQAIPRIIIAIILGFVISKPLEIKILETEINIELNNLQNAELAKFDKSTKDRFNGEIKVVDDQITKIEEDRDKIVVRQKEAEQEYIDQMQGRAGSAGYGPRAKQLEQLKLDWDKKLADFDERIGPDLDRLKKQREQKLADMDAELAHNKQKIKGLDGILARMTIAHELSLTLSIFLTLVFLSIETGPIFFKMMMNKGAYDYMVENHMLKSNVENGIFRTEHLYESKSGPILMEHYRYLEVEAIRKEREDALQAQKELNSKVIAEWQNSKLKELKDRPEDFYKDLGNIKSS
jgi:hypothetical protein